MKNKVTRGLEAKERQLEYDSLTIQQRITKLNLLFGENKGAAKERAKLASKLLITPMEEDKSLPKQEKKKYQKPKKS